MLQCGCDLKTHLCSVGRPLWVEHVAAYYRKDLAAAFKALVAFRLHAKQAIDPAPRYDEAFYRFMDTMERD